MNDQDHETAAAALEATKQYKVLRRLQPRPSVSCIDGSTKKLGIMLDLETNGLDPRSDEIIELAMVPFTYTDDGYIIDVLPAFDRLREPSKPIPAAITALTKIDDDMVKGHVIDPEEISDFIKQTERMVQADALAVVHNARFDRPFAERFHAGFARMPFACSMTQAPFTAEHGFDGTKLVYLLNSAGLYHDGHRALDDCRATIELLARPLGTTGRTALRHVLEAAHKTTVRIWAAGAPYERKDDLRARFYRWNPGADGRPKAWYADVDEDAKDTEIAWLRDEIFGFDWDPMVTMITAYERFSDRI